MILKQTLKNHIIVSGFIWITTVILLGIWWYFSSNTEILLVGFMAQLIFCGPALYMHIEYTIKNAGQEIEINHNELIVRKRGKEERYMCEALARIIVYKPASLDKGGIPNTAMEFYRYVRIITKAGDEIIITCLMSRTVDEDVKVLTGVPYERKKRLAFLEWK